MKTSAGKDEAVGRKEWGAKTKKIPSYQSAAEVFLNKDFPRSCWSSHRKDSTLPSFGSSGSPCSESASPHDCLSLNVPSGLRFKHSWNVFFETSYSHIQTKRLIWFCLFPDGRSPLRQGRHRSSRVKLFSRCNPTALFSQTSNPVSSASSSWSLTFHRVPKPSHKHRKQSKKRQTHHSLVPGLLLRHGALIKQWEWGEVLLPPSVPSCLNLRHVGPPGNEE